MTFSLRFSIALGISLAALQSSHAKTILQGTVSFLNSGSRPAAGVKISALGANDFYTTDAGIFLLEFPNKKPGDKVKIIVGSSDRSGIALEWVNDEVLAQLHLPSNPEDDLVEIIVCKVGHRNDATMRYNGLIVKTINEAMEKRLREIDEKLGAAKIDAETIMALQKEKEKLAAERDSALAKAEEQAFYISSINLDKASTLVNEAVTKVDSLQDIFGAIVVLDNEMLLNAYEGAIGKIQKGKNQVDQVIEGFKLKIKLLGINFQNPELIICCWELEKIYKEQNYVNDGANQCFDWTTLDNREIEALNRKVDIHQIFDQGQSNGHGGYAIGDIAEDFSLKNVDGSMVSLSEYKDAKGIIVIFISNHCPYSQLYEQRIIDLHRNFAPLGFPVVAINPNSPLIVPEDSFEKMQERARTKRYPFAYLFDEEQTIYPKFGATRTPHVFVLDSNYVVRYIGRVDNNPEDPNAVTQKWVENAVNALLKGENPNPAFGRAIGSAVKKAY